MAAAATATATGTDNNQLKAVTAMVNGGGDGNSDDECGRRRRHDNGSGGGVTHEAAGGDAAPLSWRDCDCGGDNTSEPPAVHGVSPSQIPSSEFWG